MAPRLHSAPYSYMFRTLEKKRQILFSSYHYFPNFIYINVVLIHVIMYNWIKEMMINHQV